MVMLSKTWSRNIGKLVRIFFLVSLCFNTRICLAADPQQTGTDLGNTAIQLFGSPEGINQAAAAPLTSSDTPMQTLDGGKTFSAQLLCPSSRKFMEVSIQQAGSGDMDVTVNQDLDMDGNADNIFQVPFLVSGVCANGVISCNAGTWINCTHYRWEADASVRIGLAATSITNLGGCYCINSSCGRNLVSENLATILKDLGGGIAGAIQAVNRKYSITDVKQNGAVITYYGQNAGQCTSNPGIYGSSSPEQYYNPQSDAALIIAKDADRNSQSADPASYYSSIVNSQATQAVQGDFRQCHVMRNVAVTTSTGCSSPGDIYDMMSNSCNIYDLSPYPRIFKTHDGGGDGSCYFAQWSISAPMGISMLYIGDGLCGDPYNGVVKNCRIHYSCGGIEKINYYSEYQTVSIPCPSADFIWIEGLYYASNENHIDCPAGYSDASCNGLCCRTPAEVSDMLNESEDDQCQAYENDPKCKLKDETVDNVETYLNFLPTSLIPMSSCRTFTGYSSHVICRDWWKKDRTYFCQAPAPFDFTDTKKRVDSIHNSITINSGSLTYTDVHKDTSGAWTTDNVSTPLGQITQNPSLKDCDSACKTRKIKSDTQAGVTGNKAQYQTTATAYESFYRLCKEGSCPVGAGEEIVLDCACLNEFNEAAAVISVLDAAGKDLICTSGNTY